MDEKLESRISEIRQGFDMPGIKVVDTSFLQISIQNDNFYNGDMATQREAIEREIVFYSILSNIISPYVTFTTETIEEFSRLCINARRQRKRIRRSLNPVIRGRNYDDSKTFKINPARREPIKEMVHLYETLHSRALMVRKSLGQNPTERYISESVWPHLNAITEASIDFFLEPAMRGKYLKKNRNYNGSQNHVVNNPKIFSKAIAIAACADQPVYILTRNHRFLDLQRKFYNSLSSLSNVYGIPIPQQEVGVFLFHKGDNRLYLPNRAEKREANRTLVLS